MIEEKCWLCDGKHEVECVKYSNKELIDAGSVPCMNISETQDEAWQALSNAILMLKCKNDSKFHDPEKCAGCEFERQNVLNLAWHYANPMPQKLINN